jgi:dimeric dUTPase (all-alpha-NTP-PPase superfamily)
MAVKVNELQAGDVDTVETYGQLDAMMLWQLFLSDKFGMYDIDNTAAIRETVSCMVLESAEALAPFLNATKPWKSTEIPWEEVDEEVIDILHFVLAYFNLRGFDAPGIVKAYRAKNLHNMKRAEEKKNAQQANGGL